MPPFEPFRGVRYDTSRFSLADVTAPPYDVISDADRDRLASRSNRNAVLIDLPREVDGPHRYQGAAERLAAWLADGTLVVDEEPSFSVYRMGYMDDRGAPAHTLGVIGALGLSPPGEGGVLPHEQTTPKAKSDRLELMRATHMNLSPVWGLSLTEGLTALLEVPQPPLAAWTDHDEVDHALWRITEPARMAAITDAVAASVVVLADGHHRYETALAYRAESATPAAGAVMAFLVELVAEQLTVRPIHRLLDELPPACDVEAALAPFFRPGEVVNPDARILATMDAAGALALIRPDGSARLLHPRPEALAQADDLDSSRLAVALESLPEHRVRYQHGVDHVLAAVKDGAARYGVLLRPATVAQIAANAHAGARMPPKTTFFYPKPKTGLVFRDLA